MNTAPLPPHIPRSDLEAWWMPFTPNRQFKANPRLLARADGMYYWSTDGRRILDGAAGLWCVNAGHNRREIAEAVHRQLVTLDYAPSFQIGHPAAFELANRLTRIAPTGFDHVFFTNSGSESVDTALKIALAYHRARGEGQRQRLIGREKAYHGVGFGGISVGGMVNNRKAFGTLLAGVDHLPHTLDLGRNAFSKGLPEHGMERANELERLVALHDASTIAAVIVEPVSGSAGVILPPKGYLKRLREICDKYGILLIFDEVITGFGRLGSPFGAQEFDVTARPHHGGQGTDEWLRADGSSVRAQVRLRRLHAGPGKRHRAVPRLHLLGASGRMRSRACDALHLSARGSAHARAANSHRIGSRPCTASRDCRPCSTCATMD